MMVKKIVIPILIVLISIGSNIDAHQSTAKMAQQYLAIKYNKNLQTFIFIGLGRQKIYLIKNSTILLCFDISSSRYGCGQEYNSEKTPLGLHKICSLAGKNTPIGGIIQGQKYTGKITPIITEAIGTGTDDVTTRAIRLEGTETGINKGGKVDTFKREIYIHGTPEEGLIGKPVSHGCIRMRNNEIIELFNQVDLNTYVLILNN